VHDVATQIVDERRIVSSLNEAVGSERQALVDSVSEWCQQLKCSALATIDTTRCAATTSHDAWTHASPPQNEATARQAGD
jgi:hypothetical protein